MRVWARYNGTDPELGDGGTYVLEYDGPGLQTVDINKTGLTCGSTSIIAETGAGQIGTAELTVTATCAMGA